MKWLSIIMLGFIIFGVGCDDENPISQGEATDEEAIFNVVMYDNMRLSEMQAFPETIPDTLAFIDNPPAGGTLYWHDVDSTTETFSITISDTPVQSPVGLVDEATVSYTISWHGSFETMYFNEPADSLERYSRAFMITGQRSAKCQKWGNTSQRRGWLLTSISGARFIAGGGYGFLQNLFYHSPSNDDSVFNSALVEIDFIPHFDTEEDVTLAFDIQSIADEVYIFIPVNNFNYELAEPQPAGDGWEVMATMPSISRIYGQFRFYVVNAGDFDQAYRGIGYSYNYRMR